MLGLFIAITWAACSIAAYGFTLGRFDHDFPDQRNGGIAFVMGMLGPIGLLVTMLLSGTAHFRLSLPTTEERWQAHQRQYPNLGREWFDE